MKSVKMKEVIKYLKKIKSHLMNPLEKKTLMKNIMLKIKSKKKTLLERAVLLMKMNTW
jgi:hypothetical protein